MKNTKKKPEIKTIKIGLTPANNVVLNSIKYTRLTNGNYLNSETKEEVKIVE